MSYDVWLEADTGGCCWPEVADCGNYTSNVSPMWDAGFEGIGQSKSLRELDGETAGDWGPRIRDALRWMHQHADEMRKLNPSNGWGNYEGAVKYLARLCRECHRHPKARIRVWL